MKSQLSRSERSFQRIVTWSYVALGLSYLIVAWLLRGKSELLLRWLYVFEYLAFLCLGLQLAASVFAIRRTGIVPTILVFIGGVSLVGFIIFTRVWLLGLCVSLLGAAGIFGAWPQIRHLFHRMADSYRQIPKSNKI